jgi:hypothetical protein
MKQKWMWKQQTMKSKKLVKKMINLKEMTKTLKIVMR